MTKMNAPVERLLATLLFCLLALLPASAGVAWADESGRLAAIITEPGMKQGDSPQWSKVDFDSKSWPSSKLGSTGFNQVLIPESIAWL